MNELYFTQLTSIMKSEIERLQTGIGSIQNGPAWHGPSLNELLLDVDEKMASAHPIAGCHSIWELVLHLIAWRTFCLKKIQQDAEFDIVVSGPVDWPTVPEPSIENWNEAKLSLQASMDMLLAELEKLKITQLNDQVLGRKYPLYVVILGITQHDTWHGGQMALLKKVMRQQDSPN